ncbi:MAG: ribosome maturation factor RimM [Saprospiraceae bacterium]
MDNWIRIGYTGKPHGLDGEIKIILKEDYYIEDILENGMFFILEKGQYLPYFVEGIRGGLLMTSIEDMETKEDAAKIAKKPIYLKEKDLIPREIVEEETLVGYTIKDVNLGEIGEIEHIEELPQQEIAMLEKNGKDIMIPLNDSFILSMDDEKKMILMELPEGLLDL